jgi:hypothetical protein
LKNVRYIKVQGEVYEVSLWHLKYLIQY